MDWNKFDYKDVSEKVLPRAGLITELDDDLATKYEIELPEGLGSAVSTIPYIPSINHVVMLIIWKINKSLFDAKQEDELRRQMPLAKIVVAYGANVKNIKIGDILHLSTHASLNKVEIKDNKISMLKQVEYYKSPSTIIARRGVNPFEIVYVADFISIPVSSIEGVYLEVDE